MSDVYGTHASKIFVQKLHISMDDLQGDQLIVLILYCTAEIQACISETKVPTNVVVCFLLLFVFLNTLKQSILHSHSTYHL